MPLHMTKIAYGATSWDDLASWYDNRPDFRLTTRYRPKRYKEMIDGSLYWVLAHQLVGRSKIIAFEDTDDGRTHIVLEPRLIPVNPKPKRAHQGWRYLKDEDAPKDFDGDMDEIAAIPANVLKELSKLGLV